MFRGFITPLYNQKKNLILYFGLFSYKPSLSLVPQMQQMNVTNKKRKGSDRCSDTWIRSEGCVLRMKSSLTIQTAEAKGVPTHGTNTLHSMEKLEP